MNFVPPARHVGVSLSMGATLAAASPNPLLILSSGSRRKDVGVVNAGRDSRVTASPDEDPPEIARGGSSFQAAFFLPFMASCFRRCTFE